MERDADFERATGVIIFMVAFLGVLTNGGVMFFSRRTALFNSCVGHLIRCEAAGALLYSFVFLFYVAPASALQIKSWQARGISARFGHIAIFAHDTCLFSHACISVNRFVATYYASSYALVFTQKTTRILVWTVPILAAIATAVHYFEDCWLSFSFKSSFFYYDTTDCGRILSMDIQFPRNVALICICSAVDLASLAKLKIINKRNRSLNLADKEWKRRQRIETALISQVCAQAAMYIIEFLTYFVISGHYTDQYVIFFLTTFAWQSVHTMDGIVVFAFNRDMKNALSKAFMATPSTMVVAPRNRSFNLANKEWKRRQRIETALISQVCAQAVMYIMDVLNYSVIPGHYTDLYSVFFLTTFAWQSVHTVDGIVVFAFNRDMKNALSKAFTASPSTVVVVPVSSSRPT